MNKFFLSSMAAGCLLLPGSSAGENEGRILFLHFQWQKDAIVLISKHEVKAQVKVSRSEQKRRRGEESGEERINRSPLSYEWVYADGEVSGEDYLLDYDERYVEYQEPGDDQLRRYSEKVDTSDFFLKISDPKVSRVRFYKDLTWESGGALFQKASAKAKIAEFSLR